MIVIIIRIIGIIIKLIIIIIGTIEASWIESSKGERRPSTD